MIERVACPVCGSHHATEVWSHTSGIANGICLNCGHAYLVKQNAWADIVASYQHFQQAYTEQYLADVRNDIFERARLRHDYLRQHIPNPVNTVLEVGCAYGHFLSLFETAVTSAGVEPSTDQSDFAKRHFHLQNIVNRPYELIKNIPAEWPANGFDLFCSFHVIEHIKNPGDLLEFAFRMLKPGAYICLAAPNLFDLSPDLIEYYFLFKNWHLSTFYPASLTGLLAKYGFEVIHWESEPRISMLRSSFILLARKTDKEVLSPVAAANADEALQALSAFHLKLDQRIDLIRQRFIDWSKQGMTVCVYGAGMHTEALLELTGIEVRHIRFIIDDDSRKWNSTIHGISIVNMDDALQSRPDVILVSSLASEEVILQKLEKIITGNIQLVGIYRDLSPQ